MSSYMQQLGETLASRMKKTSAAAIPTTFELGTIGSNLSLTTDSFPVPIPNGDYMINLMLAAALRSPKEGDRVLVAWSGAEPVVLAVVVSS